METRMKQRFVGIIVLVILVIAIILLLFYGTKQKEVKPTLPTPIEQPAVTTEQAGGQMPADNTAATGSPTTTVPSQFGQVTAPGSAANGSAEAATGSANNQTGATQAEANQGATTTPATQAAPNTQATAPSTLAEANGAERPMPPTSAAMPIKPSSVAPAVNATTKPIKKAAHKKTITKKKAIALKTKTKHHAKATGNWTIKMATFAAPPNANRLHKKLKAKGYHAYKRLAVTDRGVLTQVYVGPIKNRAQAKKILQKLEKEFKVKTMLVRYRAPKKGIAKNKAVITKKAATKKLAPIQQVAPKEIENTTTPMQQVSN